MNFFSLIRLPETLEHFSISFDHLFNQVFYLSEFRNNFTKIPKIWNKTVGAFKHLKTLCLCNAGLEDIQFVSSLPQLQKLNISGNLIEDSSLSVLDQLEKLQKLNLSYNKIDALALIPFPFTLRKLNLSGNNIEDKGVYSLNYLIYLEVLIMDHMKFISEKGLEKFEFPLSLEVLSLSNTIYRPEECYIPYTFNYLKPLKKLKSLDLSLNKLRAADIRNLVLPDTLNQIYFEGSSFWRRGMSIIETAQKPE